jgi:Domain of unknown function (DUF4263)
MIRLLPHSSCLHVSSEEGGISGRVSGSDFPLEPAALLRRMGANSGHVSYGHPVVIHDTAQKHIEIVPFYIPRSSGTELCAKIQFWAKRQGFQVGPTYELSLSAKDCLALHRMLQDHLVISEQPGDGDYIVLRLDNGTVDLKCADPATIASALAGVLSRPDIAKHLTSHELSAELLLGLRSAIRYQELRAAVDELRYNLDNDVTQERVYQAWVEQHSWAFGNGYLVSDSLRTIAIGDQVDSLLPSVTTGLRDIVELKRPNMPVLHWDTTHRNYYFSQDANKAIGQCTRYLDILHDDAQQGLRDHPEIVAYHPRAIIVIGRSVDWPEEMQRALHGLNSRLNGISIMTYDHLLAQCENTLLLVGIMARQEEHEEILAWTMSEYDCDPPFLTDSDELPDAEDEEELSENEAAECYSTMYSDLRSRQPSPTHW